MKENKKSNIKLLALAAVIVAALVVEVVVLIAITVSYSKGSQRTDMNKSEQVQRVLADVENEDVKGIFFSMFPLDSYDVNDFLTYRGINTIMLEEELASGEEVLEFLKQTLKQKQTLEAIYIGLSLDETNIGGFAQMFTDVCDWDDELLEIVKAHPQIRFHLILEYPGIHDLAKLSGLKRGRLLKWYSDMAELFTPQGEHRNMIVFLPGAESWLSANWTNYKAYGVPNEAAAKFALGQMICNDSYELTTRNVQEKLTQIEQMVAEYREIQPLDGEYTYVFFGDSVIGNYTNSMSIPEIVRGFSKVPTINCGYGGLSATKKNDEDYGLSGIIDAFLAGEYEHFEDDKPVKTGIQTFHEMYVNKEKLKFFISIGLNDYMSGCPLEGEQKEDIASFEGAVRYAVTRLHEAYPESEIILMTPNFLGLCEDGTEDLNGYVLEDLVYSAIEISEELGLKYIDVFHGLDINPTNKLTYLADMCHPNELGRFEIGKLVYEHLLNWSRNEDTVEVSAKPKVEGYGVYADAAENLENNVFFDSLVYTGYNIEKHRSDGLMWHYVLAANKRGKGWLSDITYNGGSEGYEMTAEGLPDIAFFEKYGLVCASYVTYVYFNYLPNVAGIDTSELTKPEKAYNANDWYVAAKDWVDKGYSQTIDFEASLKGGFIDFDATEEIPIGSIIAFCDAKNKSDYCSHIVIYAGYENDYHWVFHVGNENGPEFCSVERMHFGPDPQWPIAVITTPEQVIQE